MSWSFAEAVVRVDAVMGEDVLWEDVSWSFAEAVVRVDAVMGEDVLRENVSWLLVEAVVGTIVVFVMPAAVVW